MKKKASLILFVIATVGIIWLFIPPSAGSKINTELTPDLDNGLVMLQAAGCFACHSDKDDYAGGLKLDSPFGDFYSPNITMDKQHGIGSWSLSDFAGAVRLGISPKGTFYYPVMPFTSYQGMTDQDVVDMWFALKQLPESKQQNKSHEITFPFNQRTLLKGWRLLFLKNHNVNPEDRGAYLAEHVLHCGECHTPRNLLGGLKLSRRFQGNSRLPDDNAAPDIRTQTLLENGWTEADLKYLFVAGMLPDGDYVGGTMTEVTDYGTSILSATDRELLVDYLCKQPVCN